jgi:hypothetical protein
VKLIKCRNLTIGFDQCGFQISGKPIESVQSFLHLGHLITSSLVADDDIGRRYGQFVGQVKLNFQLRLRCACAATAMRERCDFIAEQSQTNFQLRLRCACDARARLRWPCDDPAMLR